MLQAIEEPHLGKDLIECTSSSFLERQGNHAQAKLSYIPFHRRKVVLLFVLCTTARLFSCRTYISTYIAWVFALIICLWFMSHVYNLSLHRYSLHFHVYSLYFHVYNSYFHVYNFSIGGRSKAREQSFEVRYVMQTWNTEHASVSVQLQ